jgi:hypothetical protein
LLRASDPFLRNLNPVLTGLKLYKQGVTSFFGNLAATFNGRLPIENKKEEKQHFLRVIGPINAETLATYPANRLSINRASAYSSPLWGKELASGVLPGFETRQCSSGVVATIDPKTAESPAFQERVKATETKSVAQEAEFLLENLKRYAFGGHDGSAEAPTPGCVQQAPFEPIYGSGGPTAYQHTFEQPSP